MLTAEQISQMTPEQIAELLAKVASPARTRGRKVSVTAKGGIYIYDPEAKAISSKGKPYVANTNIGSPEAAMVLFSKESAAEVYAFCEDLVNNPAKFKKLQAEAIAKKVGSNLSGSRSEL